LVGVIVGVGDGVLLFTGVYDVIVKLTPTLLQFWFVEVGVGVVRIDCKVKSQAIGVGGGI
jgi:hypothetical protein